MRNASVTAMRWCGLLAWLCTLLPVNFDLAGRRDTLVNLGSGPLELWMGAFLGFGALYWSVTYHLGPWLKHGDLTRRTARLTGCALMGLCALTLNATYSSEGDMTILLVLVAVLLPGLLAWPWVKLWIGAQSLLLFVVLIPELGFGKAVYTGLFLAMVQVFCAMLVHLLTRERLARRELGDLHLQLRFAQAQLEEAARERERLRISRELHDSLGHHLTVLGLELEFAAQVPPEQVRPPVTRALALNKLLLSDVRASVTTLRTAQEDWLHLTQMLVESVPGLDIQFHCPAQFIPDSAPQARTLLRFFQEAMTNTVRHAQAARLWLRLEHCSDKLIVSAHDDGTLGLPFCPGNGLTGLHERFAELGGALTVRVRNDGALHLEGQLPVSG
ncbi:sensor histidine kinase [Deinococcus humi]|uniref:Signal transduction histidine kinase n=1 Tax=Deinococcus humi TaxID=662880 RepID=A0A7W8NGB1_9DEIO|nr:histidine kinase [Deinococcus humi]MBB5363583.1 signal transduction histidine kinase [Deinococcus humi]